MRWSLNPSSRITFWTFVICFSVAPAFITTIIWSSPVLIRHSGNPVQRSVGLALDVGPEHPRAPQIDMLDVPRRLIGVHVKQNAQAHRQPSQLVHLVPAHQRPVRPAPVPGGAGG